ncbi:DUF2065 domain-containing protein [Phytohalomonas tamaricis]|uniref:DUF2065 domain-containing protein n=1 Tax=Phytohalomonas tamaricis TaxID=2081032 RepID=UPI00374DFE38
MPVLQELWIALCLVVIIEGLLPFASPAAYKRTVLGISTLPNRQLRMLGLVLMLIGTGAIWLIRSS